MAQLKYKEDLFTVSAGDTVLDTLLANNHEIPNNCRAGACQSCLMQVTKGQVPPKSQKGLKDSHKAKGLFLACSCVPEEDIEIELPNNEQLRTAATVSAITPLSNDVIELKVITKTPFEYIAGQYVTLWKDEKLGRSYSIANSPTSDHELTFHIQLIANGQFTSWVHKDLKVGNSLEVQGPAGDCFYTPGKSEQNLLLVGTGSGLAPLYGIIQDALQQGHKGEIHLFHGALETKGLYLIDELRDLALRHKNLNYYPCAVTTEGSTITNILEGDISNIALERIPKPSGWKSFLCGKPELVKKLRKKIFLAGSSMNDIYADEFIPSASSS